jgi:hypothetical protein
MLLLEQTPYRVTTAAYSRNLRFYTGYPAVDEFELEFEGAALGNRGATSHRAISRKGQ